MGPRQWGSDSRFRAQPNVGRILYWDVKIWYAAGTQVLILPGIWGDNLTLLAIAELKGVRISVLSSVAGDNFMQGFVFR